MKTYFGYLFRTLVKRSSIWIVFAIYWLYALVILIIVPAVTHISPLTLWSTDVISLQGMFVVIISVVIGVVVVFAFRASIEDETELVIVSKPIKRWKLNVVKFSWTLIAALFLAFVTSIIALFTLCFGQYDAVNNTAGMRYDKLPALIGSIWLGTVVTSLIFAAFGIMVSMVGNKIQILVTLIATSIVFSVYATISTFVLTPLYKQMQGKIGNKLASIKTINQKGDDVSYAYTFNEPNDDLYDLYKQYPQTGNQIYQYFNFQAQQSGLYNAFDVNDLQLNLSSAPFGASAQYKTTIESKDDNLLNYLEQMYQDRNKDENKNNYLLMMPFTDAVLRADESGKYQLRETDNLKLMLMGPKTDALFAMKYAGAKPDSIYVSNSTKLLDFFPARWLTMSDLYVSEDFEKDVFEKITKNLFTKETTYTPLEGEEKHLPYRNINGDWNMVSGPTQTLKDLWNEQQQIMQDYFGMCYQFMKDNSSKYDLKYDNEQHINDSMAKIWVALIKHFSSIYWFQVIGQIIEYYQKLDTSLANYKFKDYINCNDGGDSGVLNNISSVAESYKKFSTFEYAFMNPSQLKISNPYNEGDIIFDGTVDFNLMQLTRMCMAYASPCVFTQDAMTSTVTQALTAYNNIGNEIFAGAYAHIDKMDPETILPIKSQWVDTEGWWFDFTSSNYGKGQRVTYNTIAANTIDIKRYSNGFGLENMYRYETTPYIDNNVSIIVWTTVSLILIIISGIVYQRSDIK